VEVEDVVETVEAPVAETAAPEVEATEEKTEE